MRYILVALSIMLASSGVSAQPAPQPNQGAVAPSATHVTKTDPKKIAKPKKGAKKQLAPPAAAPEEPVETEMVPELSERDRMMGGKN